MASKADKKAKAVLPVADSLPTYRVVKTASAVKCGQRALGKVHYRIVTEAGASRVFLTLVQNEGGGYFSNELVDFALLEQCVSSLPTAQAFASSLFKPVFVGRSINNAGFIAAVLRAEGLLQGVADKTHLHQRLGDWVAWRQAMLEATGEPYSHPVKKPGRPSTLSAVLPQDAHQTSSLQEAAMIQEAIEPEDPVDFLLQRPPSPLAEERFQHPTLQEASHVDTA